MPGSVAGIKAGKAFILIEAVDATGKVLNSVRHRLGRFAGELTQLGKTTVMRTAAAMLPVAWAVKAGTEFDDIMRKVSARSEGTAEEMSHLRSEAISLAAATGLLPSNLAKIQDMLAQKGFNRSQISDMLKPVADLTRAGGDGLDLMKDSADAAKILAGTLQALHMPTSMTAEVADKLAVVLNVSNFNLEELASTMQYAAPAAHHFGASLDDTLAVVSAMRDANIDATIAGTSYRNMLLYMSQAAERSKFNQVLQQLTGNTVEFVDKAGKMHSLVTLIPALLKSVEGLGNVQGSDLLTQLLETRATIPATVVGGMTDNMARMLEQLRLFSGYANRVREEMDSGMGGSFRRLAATIHTTAITLSDALSPSLITIADYIKMVSGLATGWIKKNQALTVSIIAGGAALLALGLALVVTGQALFAVTMVIGLLAGIASAIAFIATPLAIAFAAAAASIYLAEDAIGEFTNTGNSFDKLFRRLPGDVNAAGQSIDRFTGLSEELHRIGKHVADVWIETFTSIGASLRSGDIEGAMRLLGVSLELQFEEIVGYIQDLWFGMLNTIKSSQSTLNPFLRGKSGYNRSADEQQLVTLEKQLAIANKEADVYKQRGLNGGAGSPEYNHRVQVAEDRVKKHQEGMAEKDRIGAYREAVEKDMLEAFKHDTGQYAAGAASSARIKALEAERRHILEENQAAVDMLEKELQKKTDTPLVDPSGKLKAILDGVDQLIIPGQKGFGVAPKALEAIESTSIESAKHFQENRYDAEMADMAALSLDVARGSQGLLNDIAVSLRKLNASAI